MTGKGKHTYEIGEIGVWFIIVLPTFIWIGMN